MEKIKRQKVTLKRAERARNERKEEARIKVEQRERDLQQALRATRWERERVENKEGIKEIDIADDELEIEIVKMGDGNRRDPRMNRGW